LRPQLPDQLGQRSEHSSGSAVDIAKINGIPILGHQARLDHRHHDPPAAHAAGTMKPHQIISLMTFDGPTTRSRCLTTRPLHVGFRRCRRQRQARHQLNSALKPSQWIKLIDRLARSTTRRCRSAVEVLDQGSEAGSKAHVGE